MLLTMMVPTRAGIRRRGEEVRMDNSIKEGDIEYERK
jgi:hypothetical protein